MKEVKGLRLAAIVGAYLGIISMANAASIVPGGSFISHGEMVVTTPSSTGALLTCKVTVVGDVQGEIAAISQFSVSGGPMCSMIKMKSVPLPGLVWKVDGLINGTMSNFGFSTSFPINNCGPSSISVLWISQERALRASSQSLSGGCSLISLKLDLPSLNVQ